uniref:Uncharacterized protein n=1 Tax=Tanacetum cinerariifolium TaxID=118510 RepID=A0A6L2NNK0_TANCI|nr:hypothetical protein [Tanacetum cinerariifolium]
MGHDTSKSTPAESICSTGNLSSFGETFMHTIVKPNLRDTSKKNGGSGSFFSSIHSMLIESTDGETHDYCDGVMELRCSAQCLIEDDGFVKRLRDCKRLMYLSFHHEFISMDHEHEVLNLDSAGTRFQRWFSAQSVRSSNAIALDSLYLLILITGASQSRQHVDTSLIHMESQKPPTKSLFDVGSSRIFIVIVNTKDYHSDVLVVITRIMRRNL